MNMPDITTAQIVAAVGAVLSALVVLFKLNLTDAQQAALLTIVGTLVPVGWFVADAIVRHGRANVAAARALADASSTLPPVRSSTQGSPPVR